MDFSGITTALITPFYNNELDKDSFLNLLKKQTDDGLRQFVINGTTGESPNLSSAEVQNLCIWFHEFKSEHKLPLKLILGTGTFSTESTIKKTKEASNLKADACLVVVPYYNKPSQEGLYLHFKNVAASTSLPILLYNVPSRTITSLSVETIQKLSKIDNIIGIKEASGDLTLVKKIKQACGKDFLFLSGDDHTSIESCFLGGDGVISVCSHVLAKEMREAYNQIKQKNQDSRVDFQKHLPFLENLYKESNPVGIKVLLKELEIIRSDELRLPLVKPENWSLKESLMK